MIKRTADTVLAAGLLVVLAPLFLAVALAIRLEDGGPVLFFQTRSGLHGRPFRLVKFRTLRTVAHDLHAPHRHVTRRGAVLRRWALDELPQLWNVLRGEMSLVGPRPTLPDQVARYGPYERRRLDVRPGLTGWAQIHGRNALSWPERIRLDVEYVEKMGFRMDVAILLRTFRVLASGRGTYGPDGRNPAYPSDPLDPPDPSDPPPPTAPSSSPPP